MGHGTMDRGESSGVSASELAAMGMCERRVALDHRHGRKVSAAQHEALQRGLRLHAAFDAQAAAERPGRRGRCFSRSRDWCFCRCRCGVCGRCR